MLRADKPRRFFWAPWLATAAAFGLCACRAKIEAHVASGKPLPAEVAAPGTTSDEVTREFLVQSLIGLNVDASTSGLGFGLAVPQDVVSTTDEFRLVVTLGGSNASDSLALTFGSEDIGSLERPATFAFPASMLPQSVSEDGSSLMVKDAKGIYSVIAPEAIEHSGDAVTIKTSQPFGAWSFAGATDFAVSASYLVVEVAGLENYESLRYEVKFSRQRVLNQKYEVRLPEHVVFQKITGNETRYVSAPANATGDYVVTVLEGPLRKDCSLPSMGTLNGRVTLKIVCKSR